MNRLKEVVFLKTPINLSIRSVLVLINGVSDRMLDARYFDKVIDFSWY